MYFSGRWLACTERYHTEFKDTVLLLAELLSCVAIWACNNPFTLQETPTQAFEAFIFAVQGYVRSQANLIAIQREQCKHHA